MRKRILIIEDDKNLVRLLKDAFEGRYDVNLALDWAEGKSKLASGLPDLIVLDILLPGESGFDALRQLKADAATRRIPVIVLSNLGQEQEIRTGLTLGAVDYLVKADITIEDVVRKVQRVLNSASSQRTPHRSQAARRGPKRSSRA